MGSEGRRGFRERGAWRGFDEMVDLWEGFVGEKVEEREREEREEIWVGILTLLGLMKRREVILGGMRKFGVGRRRVGEREREREAVGRGLKGKM